MKNSTWMIALLSLACLLPAQGCIGRAISEGVGVVTGAKGSYMALQPVAPTPKSTALVEYTVFELSRFDVDAGLQIPVAFTDAFPHKFRHELIRQKFPAAEGNKTLVIRGRIMHYESAGMMGQLFGPFEEVVTRVELVDKTSGRVLGVANCIGRSQESVNKGPEDKAEGLAKGIVSWIRSNRGMADEKDND